MSPSEIVIAGVNTHACESHIDAYQRDYHLLLPKSVLIHTIKAVMMNRSSTIQYRDYYRMKTSRVIFTLDNFPPKLSRSYDAVI